jgi:hypothetical protein
MTGKKEMFTSFEKNNCPSDSIIFDDNSQKRYLDMIKLLSLPIILFIRFCLLNH